MMKLSSLRNAVRHKSLRSHGFSERYCARVQLEQMRSDELVAEFWGADAKAQGDLFSAVRNALEPWRRTAPFDARPGATNTWIEATPMRWLWGVREQSRALIESIGPKFTPEREEEFNRRYREIFADRPAWFDAEGQAISNGYAHEEMN